MKLGITLAVIGAILLIGNLYDLVVGWTLIIRLGISCALLISGILLIKGAKTKTKAEVPIKT